MQFLFIPLIIIFGTLQTVSKKAFGVRVGDSCVFTYSAISLFFSLLYYLITSGFAFSVNLEILPYSIGYAVAYGTAIVTSLYAIKYGPLAITSLIGSCSMIIPIVFGIVFLEESATLYFYIGLVILLVALVLVNYQGGGEKEKIDPRWYIFVTIAFFANGSINTVQAAQQRAFDALYKNDFMISALAIMVIVLLAVALITERSIILRAIRKGGIFMMFDGGIGGPSGYLFMCCTMLMNVSILTPVINAGSIIATTLFSIIFFKEKFTKKQWIGVSLIIISIVILGL